MLLLLYFIIYQLINLTKEKGRTLSTKLSIITKKRIIIIILLIILLLLILIIIYLFFILYSLVLDYIKLENFFLLQEQEHLNQNIVTKYIIKYCKHCDYCDKCNCLGPKIKVGLGSFFSTSVYFYVLLFHIFK